MTSASQTPVLVLGSGLTVLGVIRSLARAGIPSYVLPDRRDFAYQSRWFRACPPSSDSASPQQELGAFLAGLPLKRAMLMPCSDAWVVRVARLGPELAERFPSRVAATSVLETLVDKGRFACAVKEARIPAPRTAELSGPADLAAVPDEWLAGAFLKPCQSQRFFERYGVKAFRLRDRGDGQRRLGEAAAAGLAMVLQEYVPGPPHHHVFVDGYVDGGGRLVASFARRRLRMFPTDFGNSTYMESVRAEEVAGAVTGIGDLLRAVKYRGIFSAEFKYDDRDRLFKILEVNARPWWYVEFAARCGVDVCGMAYRDALGLPAPAGAAYLVGRRMVYPYYDYGACRELHRQGRLSLVAWARSWLSAEQPVFRWSDPVPAAVEVARGVGRRVNKLVGRGRPT